MKSPIKNHEWMDIFDSNSAEIVSIQPKTPPGSMTSSKLRSPRMTKAICLGEKHSQSLNDRQCKLVWLLPGDGAAPEPGDLLLSNGECYELAEVEICRDLSGNIIAQKCSVN